MRNCCLLHYTINQLSQRKLVHDMMINLTFLGGLILNNRYTLDNTWMQDNCMILLFKGISNYYKYLKFETNKEDMYTIIKNIT